MGEKLKSEPHREVSATTFEGAERYTLRPAFRTLKVEREGRLLTAVGLHHSNDSRDPMIEHVAHQLSELIHEMGPENTTLISEGGQRSFYAGSEEGVLDAKGEQQLLTNIAIKEGAQIVSGEPRNNEDLHASVDLLAKLGVDSPFALYGYYVGRMGPQLLREGDADYAANVYERAFRAYERKLDSVSSSQPETWKGYSYDDFQADFQAVYGTPLGITPEAVAHMFNETVGHLHQPPARRREVQEYEGLISLVSRAVNAERDKSLLERVKEHFEQGRESIFIPYGLPHIEDLHREFTQLGDIVEDKEYPGSVHPMEQLIKG